MNVFIIDNNKHSNITIILFILFAIKLYFEIEMCTVQSEKNIPLNKKHLMMVLIIAASITH